uniref:C-type lectin domain-containing protein n=1 Tax=Cyprinus carpio carpio TaxID=630221 RepID=A0A9J7ZJK9_CYPCA
MRTFTDFGMMISVETLFLSCAIMVIEYPQRIQLLYHTDLATIENQDENAKLKQLLIINNVVKAYMGLYRDTWKWSDQSSSEFRAWMFSEPNNFGGTEFCAQLYMPDGQWGDKSCSLKLRFVCGTGKKASLFAGVCVILE